MIGIESIIIENFQSHEYTVLELSGGLNVIMGPSDHGKSAIVRAIKWVLYNEPRGSEFIRHGASFARVALKLSNGSKIIRERSKSKNRYTIVKPDGEEFIMEGFGNEVPEEVVKNHGIPKVSLDVGMNAALNISDQLEAPFMLSESGSTRAKAIGRLTGVHVIDSALRGCLSDLRREGQTMERCKDEIESVHEKLLKYENIDEMGKKLDEAQEGILKLEVLIERKNNVKLLAGKLFEIKAHIAEAEKILYETRNISQGEVLLYECMKKNDNKKSMSRNMLSFMQIKANIAEAEKVLHETRNISLCEVLLYESTKKEDRKKLMSRNLLSFKQIKANIAETEKVLNETRNISQCEALLDQGVKNNDRKKIMSRNMTALRRIEAEILENQKIIDKSHLINELSDEIIRLLKLKDKMRNLFTLKENYIMHMKEVRRYEERIKNLEDVIKYEKTMELLSLKNLDKKNLESLKEKFRNVCHSVNEGEVFIEQKRIEINEKLSLYTKGLKVLGKCPLCDSKINEEKLLEIIGHYEEVN
ncbi:MAG TPA: AAA family ATPase [Clostridia bacterium]